MCERGGGGGGEIAFRGGKYPVKKLNEGTQIIWYEPETSYYSEVRRT